MEGELIYYNDAHLIIRKMALNDINIIHSENLSHGWHSDIGVYERYYAEQQDGKRSVFVAAYDGVVAGYTTLKPAATTGPYANKGIPEVVDFNVFTKFRCKGIGGKILDVVENTVATNHKRICLGVGMHSGYGSAQRMYVKRGYIPDGSGLWYKECTLEPYSNCCNDDDLVLYLSKEL